MVSICVCDDEAVFIDIIRDETQKVMTEMKKEFEFRGFTNGAEFAAAVRQGDVSPDIVFMDIKMPGVDGHEASLILKGCYPGCQLVFVTSLEEEIHYAFDYNANGFISKYLLIEKFEATLRRVVANVEINASSGIVLTLLGDDGSIMRENIEQSNIVYLECINRKIYVTTSDGRCRRVKCDIWREMISKFDCRHFSVPHQNYIVNMRYITRLKDDNIYLSHENKCISISRRRRKEFISGYNNYSFREGEGAVL